MVDPAISPNLLAHGALVTMEAPLLACTTGVFLLFWRFLRDGNIGLVNHYLGLLGLPDDVQWTTSTPAAWVALGYGVLRGAILFASILSAGAPDAPVLFGAALSVAVLAVVGLGVARALRLRDEVEER